MDNSRSRFAIPRWLLACGLPILMTAGCASPYHQDQGALLGGLTGAGVGAVIGDAVGNPLAGAALGAGVGAMTGSAVGQSLDEIEARNRAEIEARLGRQIAQGSVSVEDVVAMTRAGVDEQVIANHVRINGGARPLQPNDLIYLQNNKVSPAVVQALQTPPVAGPPTTAGPAPVIVEEHHHYDPWSPPWYESRFDYHHEPRWHRHGKPRVGWGVSISG